MPDLKRLEFGIIISSIKKNGETSQFGKFSETYILFIHWRINQMPKRSFILKLDTVIDENYIKILELEPNFQKYFYEIITSYINGDLEKREKEEDLKRRKMRVEIELKETQIAINNKKLLFMNNFGSPPSNSANRVIHKSVKDQISRVSCFDEKNHKIKCPECPNEFIFSESHNDIAESKQNFMDHYWQNHGAIPKDLEHELREMQ